MLSSLFLGLESHEDKLGYLLVPVDHPMIKTDTYTMISGMFSEHRDSIIKVSYKGKNGHPLIIPASFKKYINGNDVDGGLESVLREPGTEVISIPVDDPAVLKNINTQADLDEMI